LPTLIIPKSAFQKIRMAYNNIREEELKNKVAKDFFNAFDCTKIVGNLDFCVTLPSKSLNPLFEVESLFWAEAKKGKAEITKSIVQLILTVGKARTFDKFLPPAFLGAFDAEKIAFMPYNDIHEIFYQNDFNWNVTPSNHETKEFKQIYHTVVQNIEDNALVFFFETDAGDLRQFIKTNFRAGLSATSKILIDKNNFMVIYNKWLSAVKPSIALNWDLAKKKGIIDGDFYLADLLSQENQTLKEKLFVLLQQSKYELDRNLDETGFFTQKTASFNDKQKAHIQFWNKYERPPKPEYWDYIVQRRDLLVPQDVRERKGSFFTPQIWVELSQKYLTDVLGDDWQDEYYIWDCAAGTGNLLAGLVNKYRIYASTLDRQDVDVIKDRIKNGANLVENHVFQFDFLNDDFDKLPKSLRDIINDPEKQKKLVIYINPPYAEAATSDRQGNKQGVSISKTKKKYGAFIGNAVNELFTQFFAVIYDKLPDATLAPFSKLKMIQAPNFSKFRNFFKAAFQKGFIVRANTFDNVKGNFPIGFMIWDLKKKVSIKEIECDILDNDGTFIGKKKFIASDNALINDWYKQFYDNKEKEIGILNTRGNDFQNQNYIYISTENNFNHTSIISKNNLIHACIYHSVRHCIAADWLNDRDQFLYPNDGWKSDFEFQNDCLTYTLFSNNIQSKYGTNHWIPFTETEVEPREAFESHFMTDFLKGKIKTAASDLFQSDKTVPKQPLIFSAEAQAVFEAGKKLWQYYHLQSDTNVNASLYDIREHFQGRNDAGKMKTKSEDEAYMKCIKSLREALHVLETKLQPKVYAYGFLKA
jgi:predicted RNA methylase